MSEELWTSPDGKISKRILKKGSFGSKPSEACECVILISDVDGELDIEKYNNAAVTVGDLDNKFGHLLSDSLLTMYEDEIGKFEFNIEPNVTFTLHLKSFKLKDLIYEWKADEKYQMALNHKEKGVYLYNSSYSDACHRFCKALKILASIPIEIDKPPLTVDGIQVSEIEKLRFTLYNNLSSCYLKEKRFEDVISLCLKVLDFDSNNEKALYKIGVAYYEEKAFDKAHNYLKKLLENYPNNKLATDKMKQVKMYLDEENRKSKDLAKKMLGVYSSTH